MPSEMPTTEAPTENQTLRAELDRLKKEIENGEKAKSLAHQDALLKNDTYKTKMVILATASGFLTVGISLVTALATWRSAQASKATAEIAIQNLQAEKARLDADRLNIDTNQKKLEIDLKLASLQTDAANKKRDEAVAALEATKNQIAFAQADLQATKRELATTTSQLDSTKEVVRELTDKQREINDQIDEVRRALGSSVASPASVIAEQRARLDRLEKQASALSISIGSKDAEIATKQVELDRLRAEVSKRATKPAEIVNENYAEVERKSRKAAEIEPNNFQVQYEHGLALQLLGRTTDAVHAYLRALRLRPNDFNSNLNIATAYLQLGEPAQALSYGEHAVQIDSRSGPARITLGTIYATLDRHDDAIVEYRHASELIELSGPLLLNWAESLGKVGRHEEMRNALEQLTQFEPSARAYEKLGSAHFKLRQYADAQAAFTKALDLDPNHFPALNGLGICLLNQYEFSDKSDSLAKQQGVSALRKSLQIERNQPRIVELIARFQ